MRKSTTPSYVGDLRRRRAPSHVVEGMRAMRAMRKDGSECAEAESSIPRDATYAAVSFLHSCIL